MSEPKQRKFMGEANSYQQTRPDYPQELFKAAISFWRTDDFIDHTPVIVDVGCGTGIATRGIYLALDQKCKVIGLEPDADMLAQAKQATPENYNIVYEEGRAEHLPFADESIDIVIAAQSIHYFDRPSFYIEAKRVLRKDGMLLILENNRDWQQSEFLTKYEAFLEENSYDQQQGHYSRKYRMFPLLQELMEHFHQTKESTIKWVKKMNAETFIEFMQSTTSAQRAMKHVGVEQVKRQVKAIMQKYIDDSGDLSIPYIANAYFAKKKR